jgi:hypothetical protein
MQIGNGVLTDEELVRMQLHADMAVLGERRELASQFISSELMKAVKLGRSQFQLRHEATSSSPIHKLVYQILASHEEQLALLRSLRAMGLSLTITPSVDLAWYALCTYFISRIECMCLIEIGASLIGSYHGHHHHHYYMVLH